MEKKMKSKSSTKYIPSKAGMALAVLIALIITTVALAAAGVLDPTFDGDGIVVTGVGGNDDIRAMVIQPDGKIVVAGSSDEDLALARYGANGALDASFGVNGIVITDIPGYSSKGEAVALQSDGKIILGGRICVSSPYCDFALVRYLDNGSLDTSFDGDGIVITDFDYYGLTDSKLSAIGIQTDGKILAVGQTVDCCPDFSVISLARYNPDGSLDTSFSGDGKLITSFIFDPSALVIQPDGKFIVAGDVDTHGGLNSILKMTVIRFNNDGTFDTSFNEKGYVIINVPPQNESGGHAVALTPNGKIVVVGSVVEIGGYSGRMVVVRLNPNGSLDTTFDGDGIVVTDFGGTKGHQGGYAAAVQLDGKIVAAGKSNYLGTDDFALARYNSDGSLDKSFSGDGKKITSIGNYDAIHAIALQADGKIVVAGSSDSDFALARYDEGGLAFPSIGTQDGWILERAETSAKGGTMNVAGTFRIGDDVARKQYRSLLSFRTKYLPDNAIITSVTLKLKRQGVTGGVNPITPFQGIMVDMKRGFFGNSSTLQITDWQAAGQKTIGPLVSIYGGGWYSLDLTSLKGYVNKRELNQGLTQIRIRFNLDDNDDNRANTLSLFSGNGAVTSRPILLIDYVMP
jgi:uncharacterized delta-60 repeat protein